MAGAGFLDFIAASTHFYVMNFRVGVAHDFAICAAFCYSALPLAFFAVLKTHYSLGLTRRWKERVASLGPLQYNDIDGLFRDYLNDGKQHLDIEVNEFLNFVTERKVVVNGEERGGHLRGLRRAYAESLVKNFNSLERDFQSARAEQAAKTIFDDLDYDPTFTTALKLRRSQLSQLAVTASCGLNTLECDLELGQECKANL